MRVPSAWLHLRAMCPRIAWRHMAIDSRAANVVSRGSEELQLQTCAGCLRRGARIPSRKPPRRAIQANSMQLITTTDALTAFCDRLGEAEFVTVDTEFMRERTYW